MKIEPKTPLVSICIPTFNGAKYIEEAMQSAINQSYPNLEIIVSDDKSSDETLEKIKRFKEKTHIPIHIYSHKPNGIGANWNYCVSKSNGNFIKFLFQDDVLHRNCISEQMDLMLKDNQIGMVYCKRNFIYDSLTPTVSEFVRYYSNLHQYWGDLKIKAGVLKGALYLKDKQFLNSPKNKIGEPTAVLLRKTVFNEVGDFDQTLQQTLDCEYWYRIMTKFKVGFVDKELISFRLHDNQASSKNKKQKIPDHELLYYYYYKRLFKFLHRKNKYKLLKLYHPVFKFLVQSKQIFLKNR